MKLSAFLGVLNLASSGLGKMTGWESKSIVVSGSMVCIVRILVSDSCPDSCLTVSDAFSIGSNFFSMITAGSSFLLDFFFDFGFFFVATTEVMALFNVFVACFWRVLLGEFARIGIWGLSRTALSFSSSSLSDESGPTSPFSNCSSKLFCK